MRTVAVHHSEDTEMLVAEQVVVGVNASTGEPFELPGVLVLRVHGGLIRHARDYMDALAVAQATRRLPSLVHALTSAV